MATTLEELEIIFKAESKGLNAQLTEVKSQLSGVEAQASKTKAFMGGLFKGLVGGIGGALVVRKLGQVGRQALDMANDVVESEQLFEESMGRMTNQAREWSDSLSQSLGLNPYELREHAGLLNVMFNSMGAGEDAAYDMATGITKLANDMASFYNLDTETAFTKLRAGLTGQTVPLQQLGILVDENTIKQYALRTGIIKAGKEMTQQQKLQARYGSIMEQTSKAQGDLARTMDSPTNQLRRLNAELDQAKIALGQALQPALISVLPALTKMANSLANVMKGGGVSPRKPFDDVVISLASATESVRSGVSSLTAQLVERVDELKEKTNTALTGYAEAAGSTKTIILNLKLKPQSNVYMRVLGAFMKLDQFIGKEAAKGIQKDIKVMMDAALEDGVVTPEEVEAVRAAIKKQIDALILGEDETLAELKASVEARIGLKPEEGGLTEEEAAALVEQAEKDYQERTGAIRALGLELDAELGIKDWTAKSMSVEDRETIRKTLQDELDKGTATALSAQSTVAALFEGTGGVESAVNKVYSGAITRLGEIKGEMDALMKDTLETDWDWGRIGELRQEYADIIEFLTKGFTSKGAFRKAAFDLQNLTPETLKNFTSAYANTIEELTQAEKSLLDQRERALFELEGEDLIKALEEENVGSLEEAIRAITELKNTAQTRIQSEYLKSALDALAPGINNILDNAQDANYSDVLLLVEGLSELIGKVEKDSLDTVGKQSLEEINSLHDYLTTLANWLLGKNEYGSGMTDSLPVFSGRVAPTTRTPPELQKVTEFESPGSKNWVVDKPTVTLQNATLNMPENDREGFIRGSAVNVDIETSDITLLIDGHKLAQTVLRYIPKVQAQTGRPTSGVYSENAVQQVLIN